MGLKDLIIKLGIFLGLCVEEKEKRQVMNKTFSTMEDFCKELFKK
jgi:hypothetical protein